MLGPKLTIQTYFFTEEEKEGEKNRRVGKCHE